MRCSYSIVKNGKILAKSYNTQRSSFDASAHAEINAIRLAGKRLKTKYLDDCTIYSTLEPCIMCAAAISYAGVKRIVYGLTLKDVFPNDKMFHFDIDKILSKSPKRIDITKNFMEEECRQIIN